MTAENEVTEEAVVVDEESASVEVAKEQDQEEQAVIVEEEKPCQDCQLTREDFLRYEAQYGAEKAADYFKQGLNAEQAQAAFVESLRAENAALKEKVTELSKQSQSAPGFDPQRESKSKLKVSDEQIEAAAKRYGVSAENVKKQMMK
jgi:hypothetical protein